MSRKIQLQVRDLCLILCSLRYVPSDLATDVIVIIGDFKFYLHKVNPKDLTSCLKNQD